jgi:hemophore-related protein
MTISGIHARRVAVAAAGSLAFGIAATTIAAPSALAAPDCSAAGVANTVSSVTGSARNYLADHPGANQVITAANGEPRPVAESTIRSYFTANPQEYNDLHGILAPIGDTQRQCNVSVLPPDLSSAYDEFMAG